MANIISLQFNDKIRTRVGRLDYTGTPGDNTDIEYWIGTNGYTTAYSNIVSTQISAGSNLFNSWTRNTSTDASALLNSTGTWSYFNHSLLPNYIVLGCGASTSGTAMNIGISAQNEASAYEQIGSINIPSLPGGFNYVAIPLICDFWTQGFQITRLAGSGSSLQVHEIFTYGAFKREDNATLGLFNANSSIETVKDSQLSINSTIGPLEYTGAITSRLNTILSTTRITLTGTYNIDSKAENIVLALNPNGASRDVILPQTPRLDHYLKIINTNGSNSLNLKETSGGPIVQELSNVSTVLTVECYWEATDSTWHIVG